MRVEFGFFEGDDLLQRGSFNISEEAKVEDLECLIITHQLKGDAAEIVIEAFSDGERLIKSTLDMPIHESEDWESIELTQFTLAFKCSLNA